MREKLDLVLKELYETQEKIEYYPIEDIIKSLRIAITAFGGIRAMADQLKNDRLVYLKEIDFRVVVGITPEGVLFCEKTSYAYPGYPIIHTDQMIRSRWIEQN